MLHPSTQQLICKLHELTQAGSLAWTIGDCDALRLWTEGYVVEIEAAPTTFRLLRDDGLRVRIAGAGAAGVRRFTWERAVERLEEELQ